MFKFLRIQSWLPTGGFAQGKYVLKSSPQYTHPLIPRKFQGLEASMLLFCGGYGVLVAALLLQAAVLPTLLSLSLVVLGMVRLRYPVRSKLQWSIDSLLALVVVAALFADSRTGGSSGPYLFLLLLLAMTFPLLMETSTAVLFAGLLLTIYFASGDNANWAVSPMFFVLRGLLVAGISLVAMRFGTVLRSSEETVEQLRRDIDSEAYNEHGLQRYGEPALRQCRLQGKAFSLVYLSMPPDWAQQIIEAKGFVSPHPRQLRQLRAQALQEIAHSLTRALPSHALIGRDANGDWLLLLPSLGSKEALLKVERAFGRPLQINFGPRQHEMFVSFMPCVVQAQEGESLLDMHARAADIWNRGILSGAV